LKDIKPAVMTVGGWFDAENLFGALEVYKNVQKNSPRTYNLLVMGPWFHGAWVRDDGARLGDGTFNVKSAELYREHIELQFFEYRLKCKREWKRPGAWVFETGANVWRQHDAGPPKDVRPKALYFHPRSELREYPPDALPGEGHDEFLSDPSR